MLEYSLDGGESSYELCRLKRSRKQSKKRKIGTINGDFVEVLGPDKRSRAEQESPNNFQESREAVDVVPCAEERDPRAAMHIPLPHNSGRISINIGDNQVKGSEPDTHLRIEQELPKSFGENLHENQKAAVDIVYSVEEKDAMTGMLAMPVPLPDDDSSLDLINFDDFSLGYDPNVVVEVSQLDKCSRVEQELPKNLNENQEAAAAIEGKELQKNFQEKKIKRWLLMWYQNLGKNLIYRPWQLLCLRLVNLRAQSDDDIDPSMTCLEGTSSDTSCVFSIL
ncbi:conserved hypothetical protein [Ricinus communis]|uniref:Uncharacterized protein n=1 Tax=Ricinus communis TaxID=3988 RepID=B9RVX3_RICCO|nr:conserved hypothetical protein [Ricinus communis]